MEKRELENQLNSVQNRLDLFEKELSSLPKKQNKVRKLLTNLKTDSQKLIKKVKQQSHELIARIEVKFK